MKVGPIEIRRNAAREDPPAGEYGVDGQNVYQRYVEALRDTNPALMGWHKFDAFDEMVHSDSTARAITWVPQLAVRSALWESEPASEDGIDQLISDALAANFGLNGRDGYAQQSWAQSIDQACLCLRYGPMFEEKVWGDLMTWVDDEGNPHSIRPIERLAPRLPRTIREVDWDKGRISRIAQHLPDAEPIPGDKLCYYSFSPEPGRWDGVSLLRPAWGPWTLKRDLMIASGIAWDRWASGFPKVRYPQNGGAAALAKAEELGRAIRNHEHAFAAFAGAPPDALNAGEGWDIEIMGGAGVLPDPTTLLDKYDYMMLGAGLMQWMALGHARTGARATAQVQDEPFYMFLEAFAGDIAVERSRQVFRQWVTVNFGAQYKVPKLTVSKIQSEDVEKLARILADLRTAGFNLSYREVQDYVLTLNKLPTPPDGAPAVAEGDGLPPAPPAPAADAARALQVAFETSLEEVVARVEKLTAKIDEPRQLELVAQQPAPINVHLAAPDSTTDEQLIQMFERSQERLLERLGEERELPPITLNVTLAGAGKARSATITKADNGDTVVRYDDE